MKRNDEKAKILVTVIPFVLIILILLITLIVSGIKNKGLREDNEELQESIKEYADNSLTGQKEQEEAEAVVNMTVPESTQAPEAAATPSVSPSPVPAVVSGEQSGKLR